MKKIIIIFIAFLLLAPCITAQENYNMENTKGVKLGLMMAGINTEGLDMTGGPSLGVFFNHPLSPSISLQPELLYSVKGSSGGFFSTNYDLDLTYIEIPVLLKATFANWGNFKPHLTLGPQFGLLLSADNKGKDLKDDFKSTDIGLTYGIGFQYLFENNNGLTFDINITNGLTNIFDVEDEDADGENESCSFMFGYFF